MKKLFLIIPFLISCASTPDGPDQAARSDYNSAVEWAKAKLVSADCSLPMVSHKETRTSLKAENCGLVDQAWKSGALEKEVCPPLELKGNACKEKVKQVYFARIEDRYSEADFKAVDKECSLFPAQCPSTESIELKFLASHNSNVFEMMLGRIDSAFKQSRERHEEKEARSSAAIGAALQGMSAGFNSTPPPTYEKRKTHYCSGIRPLAQYGCRVSCINGEWAQVCN